MLFRSLPKNKYLTFGSVFICGSLIYAFAFTDVIHCRKCAFKEGPIIVRTSDLELALSKRESFYRYSNQSYDKATLIKDVLTNLKNEERLKKYAKDHNIYVNKDNLDELYKERVKQSGSEDELLHKIKEMYGINKQEYNKVLEMDLLKEKVQQALGVPLTEWLSR